MSGVKVTGSLPAPQRILSVLDEHAKDAMTEARDVTRTLLRAEAPGKLGEAMTGSVTKTPTGYRAQIAPPRRKRYPPGEATVAQVVRWVNRGTGIYRQGPGRKRKITSKKGVLRPMILPGGRKVRSIKGQRPNPFLARVETRIEPLVRQAVEATGSRAADRLRRL
jgi:hypothetical protein